MKWMFSVLFFVLLFEQVGAVGIVTDYLNDNTLNLVDGSSTTFKILLQNVDSEELKVRVGIDSDIAQIIDYKDVYTLPPGVSNTPVLFNITSPKNAKVVEIYTVSYHMEPQSAGGGTVAIGMRMNKDFKVRIIKDPNKLYPEDYFARAILIAVIIILVVVGLKKKSGSKVF
jgi:hypothetical protein